MRMMSRCFVVFPIGGLEEPKIYQNMVCFTRMWGIYLEVLGEGVILVIVKFHF